MIDEYREAKKIQGVTEGTLYEIALSLRNFKRLVGKCNSKQIAQSGIDKFILQRRTEVSRPTLNKDIRNLKTFVNWCKKKRYINPVCLLSKLPLTINSAKADSETIKSNPTNIFIGHDYHRGFLGSLREQVRHMSVIFSPTSEC